MCKIVSATEIATEPMYFSPLHNHRLSFYLILHFSVHFFFSNYFDKTAYIYKCIFILNIKEILMNFLGIIFRKTLNMKLVQVHNAEL